MKIIHKFLALVVVVFLFTSCDEFLDVNENVNTPTDVNMSALLPTVIQQTSRAQYLLARDGNKITQHIANVTDYPERISSGAWSTIYLNVLDDAKDIQSRASGSNHYQGVVEVLEAMNIGQLADHWESAVYSEGFKATENLTPAYDSQMQLYDEINRKLASAIAHLEDSISVSIESPGADDLIYGGDIETWTKLAYTLRARYALHLSNKGLDASAVLSDLEKGLESNSDNCQLNYSQEHKNYWHLVALGNNTGNNTITQGDYMIKSMQNLGPSGDPRLPLITKVVSTIDSLDGKTVESSDDYNTDFTVDTWHSRESAPIVMVSYSEAKFIEAEVALPTDKTRAYTAYLKGIEAHMNMMGVDAAAISDYLADQNVGVGEDSLTLSNIMMQKYFAMYLTTEAWVDMRRHHYDAGIYPDFVPGDPHGLGGVIQRMYYPDSEFDRNGVQVNKVKKDDLEVMWRDQ